MNNYENLIIFNPDIGEERVDKNIEDFKKAIEEEKGEISTIDKWGIRELAYPIRRKKQGFYVRTLFKLNPQSIKKLHPKLRFNEDILRYMIVKE